MHLERGNSLLFTKIRNKTDKNKENRAFFDHATVYFPTANNTNPSLINTLFNAF